MSKKLIALLMASIMLLSLAVACGKDTPDTPVKEDTPSQNTPTPSEPTPVEPTKTEKIYRTYMTTDIPLINSHDTVSASIQTPYDFCNATLFRSVPDEDGRGYHYIGDLAVDLPELVETKEGTYAKYIAEEQADGSTKQILTEEVGTLTVWQVEIRDNATWHNGEKLDAEDIIYSWKMQMDPVMLNQMSNFIYNQAITILNGEKYFRGDCEWDEVGLEILEDGKTIQITCVGSPEIKTFCSHFVDRSCYMVYEPFYEAGMSEDRTETTYGDSLDTWMGAGPYYFETWEQDNKHVYKKNPDHWLADLFHYDVVEVYIVKEKNAAIQMFEAGKLDDLTPDSDSIETYIEDPRLVSYPSTMVYHFDINDGSSIIKNEKNPIADTLAWRKAIYHSIDRETIAKQFYGYMEPAGWYVSGQAGLLSESGQTYRESEWGDKIEALVASWSAEGHYTGYNPELARKYLKEALAEKGLPEDTKIECIFLISEVSKATTAAAEWLDPQFDEIFEGQVDLILSFYPSEIGSSAAKKQFAWDLNFQDWSRALSRTYPSQCFYYLTSGYGSHPNYYTSKRFDQQYDVCLNAQDGDYDKLLEETYNLELIYLEDVINCPVTQVVNYTLFSERLQLPVETYIPGFGWGTKYGDIIE